MERQISAPDLMIYQDNNKLLLSDFITLQKEIQLAVMFTLARRDSSTFDLIYENNFIKNEFHRIIKQIKNALGDLQFNQIIGRRQENNFLPDFNADYVYDFNPFGNGEILPKIPSKRQLNNQPQTDIHMPKPLNKMNNNNGSEFNQLEENKKQPNANKKSAKTYDCITEGRRPQKGSNNPISINGAKLNPTVRSQAPQMNLNKPLKFNEIRDFNKLRIQWIKDDLDKQYMQKMKKLEISQMTFSKKINEMKKQILAKCKKNKELEDKINELEKVYEKEIEQVKQQCNFDYEQIKKSLDVEDAIALDALPDNQPQFQPDYYAGPGYEENYGRPFSPNHFDAYNNPSSFLEYKVQKPSSEFIYYSSNHNQNRQQQLVSPFQMNANLQQHETEFSGPFSPRQPVVDRIKSHKNPAKLVRFQIDSQSIQSLQGTSELVYPDHLNLQSNDQQINEKVYPVKFTGQYTVILKSYEKIIIGGQDNSIIVINNDGKSTHIGLQGKLTTATSLGNKILCGNDQGMIEVVDLYWQMVMKRKEGFKKINHIQQITNGKAIVVQDEGFASIIRLNGDYSILQRWQLSIKQQINSVTSTSALNEFALSTSKGVIFIQLFKSKPLQEKESMLNDDFIISTQKTNQDGLYIVLINNSNSIKILERSSGQIIREIQYVTNEQCNLINIQPIITLLNKNRYFILKDQNSLNLVDFQESTVSKLCDCKYDSEFNIANNLLYEEEDVHHQQLKFYSIQYDNTKRESQIMEFRFNL